MSEDEPESRDPQEVELEREVRAGRQFSLAEAIGRAAGDLMKGASPATRRHQAEAVIEEVLERRLADAEGALSVVLERRVLDSEELLERGYAEPVAALAAIVRRLLDSPGGLRRFVHEVDAEWGRLYSQRPFFESETAPPRPGDPYTVESVRAALETLQHALRESGAPGER